MSLTTPPVQPETPPAPALNANAAGTLVTADHLRALWDHAPLAVWVHCDLRLVYINPFGLRSLGAASEAEVLGRSPLDFVIEEDRSEILRRKRETVDNNRTIFEGVLRFRALDGRVFSAQEVVWPIVFEGRRSVQATFHDLTAATETEQALAASRDALSASEQALFATRNTQFQMLESLPQLVWTTLPDGKNDYFNRRWCEYTGIDPESATAERWTQIIHPEDLERTRKSWEHSFATGDPFRIEFRLRGADGAYRWFLGQAHPLRDDRGHIARWFGACTDIDEQRRSAERLRRSEERFRTATQAVSDILWTNDAAGQMTGEQPGWSAFTGQNYDEYQGYGWAKAVHPDDAEPTVRAWQEAVRSRSKFVFEHRVRRHDGVWRLFAIRALPICNQDGSIREWVGVHTDITERRAYLQEVQRLNAELEERVRQRTAELEASNHELEAFSYSVSHDLRAPLRTIDGFSLALEEDAGPQLDPENHAYLRRIRQAVQRMGGLIDALLQLSRVTRADIQRSETDLSLLAQEIADALQRQQPERAVEFRIQPNLIVNADIRLLQVAMENLLGNAWKFTSKQPEAVIEFGAQQSDGQTEYFVRDNGAGFDMQYAGKLFTAFQRLHGDKDFQGSGIGLATVQRVIRRHGGSVRAEGEPNRGATFYFTLS